MTHITEKVAEFVFEELTPSAMADARLHLTQCQECRKRVEEFQSTYAMLKTSPDHELPRRILFEFEKPRSTSWIYRWLAPMATSAAVALAIVTLAPRPQPQPQIIERVVQQQQASAVPQQVNYQQMIDEIRTELKKQNAEDA